MGLRRLTVWCPWAPRGAQHPTWWASCGPNEVGLGLPSSCLLDWRTADLRPGPCDPMGDPQETLGCPAAGRLQAWVSLAITLETYNFENMLYSL